MIILPRRLWQDVDEPLGQLVAQHHSEVPTMWIQGCGQEECGGAIHCYLALKRGSKSTITTWSWVHGGPAR